MARDVVIGSLFSGIGGLELGLGWALDEAGIAHRVAWQIEREAFPRAVLARHWPDASRSVIDVCEANADNLSYVDVMCGGFPCQDISVAGKGAGLAGERSGLWREFARLIRELRPRVVVVENVSAIVVRGLASVLADLAALGFDAEWTTLRAADVGAPHKRERLFVVAWRVSDAKRDGIWELEQRDAGRDRALPDGGKSQPFDVGTGMAYPDSGRREGERGGGLLDGKRAARGDDAHGCGCAQLAVAVGHGLEGLEQAGSEERATPRRDPWPPSPNDLYAWGRVQENSKPSVCRVAHGDAPWLARRRDKLRALGNAVVPQVAQIVGRRVVEVLRGP